MSDNEILDGWVYDPPSVEIAEILNVTDARTCVHGLTDCFVRCGVYRSVLWKQWVPQTLLQRLARVPFVLQVALYPHRAGLYPTLLKEDG